MAQYWAKYAYKTKEVAETYDKVRFTSSQGKLLEKIEKNAVRQLMGKIGRSCVILDLASGSGRFTKLAADEGNLTASADISLELLKISKWRFDGDRALGFVLCDAERLPFKDKAFDCTISIRFLSLLPPLIRRKVLRQISRVTRSWTIINLSNKISVALLLKMIWRLAQKSPEYHLMSLKEIQRELATVGFDIVEWQSPLLIKPPRRLPEVLLGIVEFINRAGNRSFLGYFSEQYFFLLSAHH